MASDIQTQHFLFRKTPKAWHPFIKIARMDRPIGVWLLWLPCLWALALSADKIYPLNTGYMVLFGVGAYLMRSAGCIINDLWDHRLDGSVARTQSRPLPAGDMTRKSAFQFLGVLMAISFFILIQFNWTTILLGVVSLIPVILYPLMKRITWWPQAFLGLTFNFGALMGWAAMTGAVSAPAYLLYIGGIFWTLAYDTIYAHQDKEDDAMIGIKSTALLFGQYSKWAVGVCFGIAMIAFICAHISAKGVTPDFYIFLLPLGHIIWQMTHWQPDIPSNCLSIFKSNRIFGLFIFIAFLI